MSQSGDKAIQFEITLPGIGVVVIVQRMPRISSEAVIEITKVYFEVLLYIESLDICFCSRKYFLSLLSHRRS